MNQLIIGVGEIGSALKQVLSPYQIGWIDLGESYVPFSYTYAMHVCIPYSSHFEEIVMEYQTQFEPLITIIHSTVPIGTSDKLGAVHSPVRGVHPDIAKGIRTFVKFFGGKNAEQAAFIFSEINIKTKVVDSARNCEAAKIWDTTQYGVMIRLNKLIHEYCEANNLDFDTIYTEFNQSYNEGYTELGRAEVVRPYLKYMPGKIGGHCVLPNLEFIKESPVYNFVSGK